MEGGKCRFLKKANANIVINLLMFIFIKKVGEKNRDVAENKKIIFRKNFHFCFNNHIKIINILFFSPTGIVKSIKED